MMRISRLVGLIIAIVIAAFALPSVAGNDKKQYSLQMSIVSAPPAQTTPPFTVKATLANEGNSTINSFRLFVVGMVIVGVDQPATGHATFDGSSVSVTGMHPLKSGDSLAVTIRVNSCGDGSWRAAVWTGSSLNGQNFALVQGDSNLMTSISCGISASGAFVVPNSITNCGVSDGQRDFYDKDGSTPVGVPYFVTNTVPINGQLHFRWPTNAGDVGFEEGLDPAAAFQYSVCASGTVGGTIRVAWLNTDGTPSSTLGTPVFLAGQDCLALPLARAACNGACNAACNNESPADALWNTQQRHPERRHNDIRQCAESESDRPARNDPASVPALRRRDGDRAHHCDGCQLRRRPRRRFVRSWRC